MKVGLHDTESKEPLIAYLAASITNFPNCCSARVVYGINGGTIFLADTIYKSNYTSKPVTVSNLRNYFSSITHNGLYALPYYYGYIQILKEMADLVRDITYGTGTFALADRITKRDVFSCKTFIEWLVEHPEFCNVGVSLPAPGAHGTLCFGAIVGISYEQKLVISKAYKKAIEDVKAHVEAVSEFKANEPLPAPIDLVAALWA